jgi:preprotein translocase subunit SecE
MRRRFRRQRKLRITLAEKNEKKAELTEKKENKPVKKTERKEPNFVQRYFRETSGELRKVTWPSREEATNMTILVLIVLVVMSLLLGVLVDGFAQELVRFFVNL